MIWIGTTDDSPDQVWAKHSDDVGAGLSVLPDGSGAAAGGAVAWKKASGATDQAYFYCSTLVVGTP